MPASATHPPAPDPGPPVRRPRAGTALASTVFRRADQPAATGRGTPRSAPVTSPTRPAGTRCTAGTSPAASTRWRPTGPTARRTRPCPPTARELWWFDDTDGDEFGSWRAQPFGVRPRVGARRRCPTVAAGYPAGLEVGTSVVLAGFSDDDGTRIHLARTGGASRRSSTGTPRTAGSARCPPTRRSGCCRIPSTATPATRRCGRCRCRPATSSASCPTRPGKGLAAHDLLAGARATSGCWSGTSGAGATSC